MEKKNPLFLILGISAACFVIFLVVTVGALMNMGSPAKSQKKLFRKNNTIAVIEVKGVIMDSKKVLEQIESFSEDEGVKAVLIRINSPGGAVAPSQEIYEGLRRLGQKKPVYSSMSSLAASGGYYIACGTKKIFANPGTITGSIGVIMQFADLSKLFQWAKINPYVVKTGKFKDVGSPNREMGQEEKNLLQAMIDNVLMQFRAAVVAGRGIPMDRVIELSDGRIFSGEQAKQVKLVDELGGIDDAISALAKEAGISGKPNIIYGTKKKGAFERIFGELDDDAESESSQFGGSRLNALARLILGVEVDAPVSRLTGFVGPLFLATRFVQ